MHDRDHIVGQLTNMMVAQIFLWIKASHIFPGGSPHELRLGCLTSWFQRSSVQHKFKCTMPCQWRKLGQLNRLLYCISWMEIIQLSSCNLSILSNLFSIVGRVVGLVDVYALKELFGGFTLHWNIQFGKCCIGMITRPLLKMLKQCVACAGTV